MTHVTHSTLIDYTYGELSAADAERVAEHLRACPDCEASLAEWQTARASLATMLAEADRAEPEEWDDAIAALYARRERDNVVHFPVRRPAAWRWAASIVLLCGTAAAFAALRPQLFPRERVSPPAEEAQSEQLPAAATGGVTVEPVAGSVDVELIEAGSRTRVEISITQDEAVAVHSYGDSPASFVAHRGRVEVRLDRRPTTLRVRVPAHLAEARIRANGADVAVVQSGRTHVLDNSAVVVVTAEGH